MHMADKPLRSILPILTLALVFWAGDSSIVRGSGIAALTNDAEDMLPIQARYLKALIPVHR